MLRTAKTIFYVILIVFGCLTLSFSQDIKESTTELEEDWAFDDDYDTVDHPSAPVVWDPLEKINRGTFYVNDKLYFWCIKPVAQTYKKYTPGLVRLGLMNFFNNINMPQRAVNCLLQIRPKAFGTEIASFAVNTTVGILGFSNAANKYFHLKPHNEDLGQTLGTYGIDNGFYIVLPFLGSSSLRDLTGVIGDNYLDPINYVDNPYVAVGVSAVRTVNTLSFRLGEYEKIKEAAFEPYSAIKDGYIQYRNKQIEK